MATAYSHGLAKTLLWVAAASLLVWGLWPAEMTAFIENNLRLIWFLLIVLTLTTVLYTAGTTIKNGK